ncbi:hypothetical protein [Jidongwangia harbinensis]|uniref:hypothetical protein n=1 Tax=Jidongwangia harbinensis TaxID=2878561 RepID=UPI001CD919F5|nr:hypothetical protein [Jidongwangia harbinensis]MCA2214739.1 hypothetical protein [Jidongwangia harbinensis]
MTAGEGVPLTGWALMSSGVFAVVVGSLWTLQGLDVLGGSAMSGVTVWAAIGPVVALAGLVLIVLGVRRRNRAKTP